MAVGISTIPCFITHRIPNIFLNDFFYFSDVFFCGRSLWPVCFWCIFNRRWIGIRFLCQPTNSVIRQRSVTISNLNFAEKYLSMNIQITCPVFLLSYLRSSIHVQQSMTVCLQINSLHID